MGQESRSSRSRNSARDSRDSRDSRDFPDRRSGPAHGLPPRPPPPARYENSYRPPPSRPDYQHRESNSHYDGNSSYSRDNDARLPPTPHRDAYRPPQGEFTFRAEKPNGVQSLPSDSYRPQEDHSSRSRRDHPPSRRSRGGGRPYAPRKVYIPAERELLSASHSTGPERALYNEEDGIKFRPVDELSDSEEAEMDISGDEDEGPAEPTNKRSRLARDQSAADGDSVPKWSNPDPYTAIPPGESTAPGKKRDVVHLIRKARVQGNEVKSSLPPEAPEDADFIACDSSDESDEEDSALGSRKRTRDDVIKTTTVSQPAQSAPVVVQEWKPAHGHNSTPWYRDRSKDVVVGVRLHKEIVDFYEYIRPRDFEARMRGRLVKELGDFCRALWSDAGVHPFGSYPTELYLPTSDMDLVVVSDRLLEQGGSFGRYSSNKSMRTFGATLKSKGFISGEPEYILGAKVPLVKFVNVQTQLKIDVSFENTSGLQGVSTFKAWKEQYPAMPVLVTLIKHFLGMRGLNEPVNGGIGGFSVICLVVSMLQMMPQVQSRSMDTMHHLGDLFMEFLDLYGNRFNYHDVAICLDPPRYIPKNKVTWFPYKHLDRLSIVDPNRQGNDIAGGSKRFPEVVAAFREAFHTLQSQMQKAVTEPKRVHSLLSVLLAGNYSHIEKQRAFLQKLDRDGPRFQSLKGLVPVQHVFPRSNNQPNARNNRGPRRGRR